MEIRTKKIWKLTIDCCKNDYVGADDLLSAMRIYRQLDKTFKNEIEYFEYEIHYNPADLKEKVDTYKFFMVNNDMYMGETIEQAGNYWVENGGDKVDIECIEYFDEIVMDYEK